MKCVCVYVNSFITSQEAHHDSLQKKHKTNSELSPGIISVKVYIFINSDVMMFQNQLILKLYVITF